MMAELSCDECREHLLEYSAGMLAAPVREAVERHLRTCDACHAEARRWQSLAEAVRDRERQVPADWGLSAGRDRLLAVVSAQPNFKRQHASKGMFQMQTKKPTLVTPVGEPDVVDSPLRERGVRRGFVPALVAVLVVAVLGALLAEQLHGRGPLVTPGGQSTASMPPAHHLAANEVLPGAGITDVQMLSADDGWAIGGNQPAGGCPSKANETCQSLILHYTGGRWTQSGTPLPNVWLTTLSMVSASEGWAGGSRSDPTGPTISPVLLHYTGGSWREVPVLGMGAGEAFKIDMLSADDGWAIVARRGAQYANGPFFLWHYMNGTWSVANAPGSNVITLSMVSPTDGWAAGTRDILRYQNGQWTRWGQHAPGVVTAIQMVSATDGWMGGVAPDGGGTDKPHSLFMLHYDGTSWQPVSVPSVPGQIAENPLVSDIASIAMVSHDEGWAVGNVGSTSSLILHYVNGAWHLEPFAVDEPLYSVSMFSASEGWAVGAQRDLADYQAAGVLLHFAHGTWSIYKP